LSSTGRAAGSEVHGGSRPRTVGLVRACAALTAIHAWILFSSEPKLIVWIDSVTYLGPALSVLGGGPFTHVSGHGFVYPGWLSFLLSIDPRPSTIVTAQRLLVLGTYLCLAAAFVTTARQDRVREWAGHAAVAPIAFGWLLTFVLYPPAAGFAHIVMPEVLFGFLLSVIVVAVVAHAAPMIQPRVAGMATAVAVLASIALTLVKPHWLLSALALPILLPLLAPPSRRRGAVAIVGVAVCAGGVLLLWPELKLRAKYDPVVSVVFGPRSLFCNSADLMQGHLATHGRGPVDAAAADALSRMLTPQARAAAPDWWLLGFNGDSCTHGDTGRIVAASFAGRPRDEAAYYLTSYADALARRPWYLARRLAAHAAVFAAKPFNAVSSEYFVRASPLAMVNSRQEPVLARWLAAEPRMFEGLVALPTRPIMLALRVFFVLAGAALVATTLCALLAIGRGAVPKTIGARAAFLILLPCVLAMNVLVATVHTFEPRYLAMQTPLWAATGFMASLTIAGVVRRYRSTGFR
jgi:hypothetical protein